MEYKEWTTMEIKYIKENVRFGSKNQVINKFELTMELNRSKQSIDDVIRRLRKKGYFPKSTISPTSTPHVWTEDEVDFILNNIEYDNINKTANLKELSVFLNLNPIQVKSKIDQLRKKGLVRAVDFSNKSDQAHKEYSDNAIKIVIGMYKQNRTCSEISYVLDRSINSIYGITKRLKETGVIENRVKKYSEKEENYLINNIQFDQHGYVCNYDELCRFLKRPAKSVQNKVGSLRSEGRIETTADKTTISVNMKVAFKRGNAMVFSEHSKEKRKEYAKN